MFMLKAATLGLQNPQQTAVDYLGKAFGHVQTFRLSDKSKAEAQCRDASKAGKLSLLVEFADAWVLYCEGVAPPVAQPGSPMMMSQLTKVGVAISPSPIGAVNNTMHPVPGSELSVQVEQADATLEPQYREIYYRGSIIRKPIQSLGDETSQSKPRSYRGASY